MTVWSQVFLGTIAIATLLMAIVQVGAAVYAGRLAKRVDRLADQVEQEIRPLFVTLNSISRDAARAVSLAATQVERADRLMADFTERAEQTMAAVQHAVVGPARHGFALWGGVRAALAALRDANARQAPPSTGARGEDEDALFI